MRKTTGQRLLELMELKGISQADMARDLGVARSTISNYLSDNRSPKQNIISLIAKTYNVSETWILGFDNDDTNQAINANPVKQATEHFEIIDKFSKLNDDNKEMLIKILNMMLQTQ